MRRWSMVRSLTKRKVRVLVWWCVFLLPSQRSARYLIPTLPALAICVALVLPQLGRWAHVAITLLVLPAVLWLGRVGWVLGDLGVANSWQVAAVALAVLAGLGAVAMVARLDAKDAVGLGDQPVAADQAVSALR